MIEQLSLFGIPIDPIQEPHELPEIILQDIDPQVEEAIATLREIKKEAMAQFQAGTRIAAGDLHGEVVSVINEMLCLVRFDGELKPRQVFTDSLSIEYKPALAEGCLVRSSLYFKGKIAKVISLKQVHTITMATVELEINGSLVRFPCGTSALEVVECN